MDDELEDLGRASDSADKFTTGLAGIDKAVGYFAPENLITVASIDRGMASTLAINIISNAVFNLGIPTLALLPGRNLDKFMQSLQSCNTGIPESHDELTPQKLSRLKKYLEQLERAQLIVNTSKQIYFNEISEIVRSARPRPKLILIDAIQLLDFEEATWENWDENFYYEDRPDEREHRADQLAEVSRGLKHLASYGGTTVVAVTWRDLRAQKADWQSGGADPGGLEAYDAFLRDSDVVLEVDPPSNSVDTRRKVWIRKNRWGPDKEEILMTVDRATYRMKDSTLSTGAKRK